MIVAVLLALSMVLVTFIFHYRVLLLLGAKVPALHGSTEFQVLIIVIVLFFTHVAEIAFYALVYELSVSKLALGIFQGAPVADFMTHLYYSGVIYTSLGLGDIYPEGHIRFITAVETLNGFLLITWSASFTFLAMGRLWTWDDCCDDNDQGRKTETEH